MHAEPSWLLPALFVKSVPLTMGSARRASGCAL